MESLDSAYYLGLGTNIARLRSRAGITQEELAERAAISPSYLAHIEAGSRRPTLDVLRRLARALDLRVAALLPDEPDQAEIRAPARTRLADSMEQLAREDQELLRSLMDRLGSRRPRRRRR